MYISRSQDILRGRSVHDDPSLGLVQKFTAKISRQKLHAFLHLGPPTRCGEGFSFEDLRGEEDLAHQRRRRRRRRHPKVASSCGPGVEGQWPSASPPITLGASPPVVSGAPAMACEHTEDVSAVPCLWAEEADAWKPPAHRHIHERNSIQTFSACKTSSHSPHPALPHAGAQRRSLA